MRGLLDLPTILANLNPELIPGEFVFASLPLEDISGILHLDPIGIFREREGLTIILHIETARNHSLPIEVPLRQITLNVHSDLAAVGLTTAIAQRLTDESISANVIAGCYHDHLFVPAHQAERALLALQALRECSAS